MKIILRIYFAQAYSIKKGSFFSLIILEKNQRGVNKMKRDRSDIFSNFEFAQSYQLNSTPEAILPMDQKLSNLARNTKTTTRTSEEGIMFALGFIATLLFFSGMQLYRSLNTNPVKVKTKRPYKVLNLNTEDLTTEMPLKKLNYQHNKQIVEILTIKNAISHGKL